MTLKEWKELIRYAKDTKTYHKLRYTCYQHYIHFAKNAYLWDDFSEFIEFYRKKNIQGWYNVSYNKPYR